MTPGNQNNTATIRDEILKTLKIHIESSQK